MRIAMVGLGRMGSNMSRRLLRAGHECVVYDKESERRFALQQAGAIPADSLNALVSALPTPKAVWIMLPAGEITESTVQALAPLLAAGDIIVDGGNSYYKDDVRRAKVLEKRGIHYLDVGVSGGIWGLQRGFCLMMGGDPSAVHHLDPIFQALAPGSAAAPPTPGRAPHTSTADLGYFHCGNPGAGHFVKMIHNGIEYALMQGFAEGFDILKHAQEELVSPEFRYRLDLREISEVWRRGSVISSWLLDLVAQSLNQDPELRNFEGFVQDSGEGRWTVNAAIEEGVPAACIAQSLFVRFRSRETQSFGEKLLSAMRSEFGGHAEPKSKAS